MSSLTILGQLASRTYDCLSTGMRNAKRKHPQSTAHVNRRFGWALAPPFFDLLN